MTYQMQNSQILTGMYKNAIIQSKTRKNRQTLKNVFNILPRESWQRGTHDVTVLVGGAQKKGAETLEGAEEGGDARGV